MSHEYIEMPMPVIIEKFRADHKDDYSMGAILEEIDEERSKALVEAAHIQVDESDLPPVEDDSEDELDDGRDWQIFHPIFQLHCDKNLWVCDSRYFNFWKNGKIDELISSYEETLRIDSSGSAETDFLAGARDVIDELGLQKVLVNQTETKIKREISDGGGEESIDKLAFVLDAYKYAYLAAARVAGSYVDMALLLEEARRV